MKNKNMKNNRKAKILAGALSTMQLLTPVAAASVLIACEETKPEEKTEKSYLAPGTKVTIKYMGFASDTGIPAEISKLAGALTAPSYSNWDRTIYVIDDSATVCSVRPNGTMQAGRQWIINTPQDDIDDAIYVLRNSWTAMIKSDTKAIVAQLTNRIYGS